MLIAAGRKVCYKQGRENKKKVLQYTVLEHYERARAVVVSALGSWSALPCCVVLYGGWQNFFFVSYSLNSISMTHFRKEGGEKVFFTKLFCLM